MSSTTVVERPVFRSAEYLAELVRKNRAKGEPACEVPQDVPPFLPFSSFVLPDGEVIECEAVGQ